MMVLQKARVGGGGGLKGVKLERWGGRHEIAKFDLTLSMWEEGGVLGGSLEYAKDLFEAETMERLGRHYEGVLKEVVKAPERRLWEVGVMGEREREQLLVEWNETEREYGEERCVQELFEEQVERTPEAIAVVYEEGQVSYGELNRRANGLAWRLREMGVKAESRVGLCMERSTEIVIGILGILKAGGAYVPMDPDYPAERLSYMLEDAQAAVIVTRQRLQNELLV